MDGAVTVGATVGVAGVGAAVGAVPPVPPRLGWVGGAAVVGVGAWVTGVATSASLGRSLPPGAGATPCRDGVGSNMCVQPTPFR